MSDMSPELQEEKRGTSRSRALYGAKIILGKTSTFDCVIKSRSDKGFGLKLGSSHGIPDEFVLFDEKHDVRHDVRVVWRKRTMLGVEIKTADSN